MSDKFLQRYGAALVARAAASLIVMKFFLDLNKKLPAHIQENMDNGLFILFAPERATSALHTL